MFGQIILQIILIALIAFLTCAETAIISANDSSIDKLASGRNKRALRLKKLLDKPNRFLESIRCASFIIAFFGAAFAAENFSDYILRLFKNANLPVPNGILNAAAVAIVTLIAAFITLLFGKLLPKRIAAKNPEKISLALSGPACFTVALFTPSVWLLNISASGIMRIIGIDPSHEENTVTEEEILMMSDAGAEKGTIDEDENRIIKNVFAFDDMTAGQICTHRTDVSVLWADDSSSVWEETIHRTRHSVFPICGENVDNVIGTLNAKDFFQLEDKSKENIMNTIVREPYFVHENMKADRLFARMKQNDADRFAVVVDEYGGMSGILTVTDLVEQLVGDFDDDDSDEPSHKLKQISENEWIIPGITPMSEVADKLDAALPADKYDTFGGYVIAMLGEIPKDGTQVHLDTDALRINVLEIKHHRIENCRVEKILPPVEDEVE
jgi:putative hemolysin